MKIRGAWNFEEIESYLENAILPARIATVSPNGWPMVVSLWYLYEEGELFCATKNFSRIAECIGHSGKCAFEIACEQAPYFGIRGQGKATLSSKNVDGVLERLAQRYLGSEDSAFRRWLLSNTENEVVVRINPIRYHGWDYRNRMAA